MNRNALTCVGIVLAAAAILPVQAAGVVRVQKKGGGSYYRTKPDGDRSNNFSSRGNYNPFTGKRGTKSPYGGSSRSRSYGGSRSGSRGYGGGGDFGGYGGYGDDLFGLGGDGGASRGGNTSPPSYGGTSLIPGYDYTPYPLTPKDPFLDPDYMGSAEVLTPPKRVGPQLAGAKLAKWDLALADLRFGNLSRVDFTGANLIRAEMEGADLRQANLKEAMLTGACLKDARLAGASFLNADLRGADLRYVDLSQADLTGADLKNALYNQDTTWPPGIDPKTVGAVLKPN